MTYADQIAVLVSMHPSQVTAVIDLLDHENTIPFIARYRKEATGGMDEEKLRLVEQYLGKLRALDERREHIISAVEKQGKLTPELLAQLQDAETMGGLEDLYQPYRPKRTTRASIARQKGLQGLADLILSQPVDRIQLAEVVKPFLSDLVTTEQEAWAGARDIVAETISDQPEVRQKLRAEAKQWGIMHCEKIPDTMDDHSVYQAYYAFDCAINRLRPHQVLAINRGEREKILRVRIVIAEKSWHNSIYPIFRPNQRSPLREQLEEAIADAADRLLVPAIERDIRRELTDSAGQHAINVFAKNLHALLGQPPLANQVVLGLDPGFRTGCKVAVVDKTGKLLDTATIYPHEPQKDWRGSLKTLATLVRQFNVSIIAIGNGTASRESEQLVAELIQSYAPDVKYIIVSEAGASVYSASPLARKELPHLDVTLRGAVSIARRVQDPLAELVKIEPKAIGVGLYQHDVDQKLLETSLDQVVESVVNSVGVDLNSASISLLTHVAGISSSLAEKIVKYRDEKGAFQDRESIKKVNGLGPKAFEQCAGFLRIRDGSNPLDASAIHPESYPIAETVSKMAGFLASSTIQVRQSALDELQNRYSLENLAKELGCGVPTLMDISEQLLRPGRDPRLDAPPPILRSDILKMDDLVIGMELKGTIRNVVDFGAFVDIGLKQDGLLHRSQLPAGIVLRVGDIVDVQILNVEPERDRIALGWLNARKGA